MSIKAKFTKWIIKQICKINPRYIANKAYRSVFNKNIDWSDPPKHKTLIESIYWLQLYSDTSLWTLCADKYRVHNYVRDKGLGHILNPIYGVWKTPEEIEWDKLPNEFVLKTNNSSGQVLIIRDKTKIDKDKITIKIRNWLKSDYGTCDVQLHYTKIDKLILAEKLLNESNNGTTDYKIWCINGIPQLILVCFDRDSDTGYKVAVFDLYWNDISHKMRQGENIATKSNLPKKPQSLNQMLNYAKILASGFPEVRVDFYEQNGKPVFGEMTFTTGYGGFSENMNIELGKKIDLTKVKKINHMNKLSWYK